MAGIGRAGNGVSSGRKKGTLNKKNQDIQSRAAALGIDPFEILLLLASGDWKALGYKTQTYVVYSKDFQNDRYYITPEIRAKCAAEACAYLHSKRGTLVIQKTQNSEEGERPYRDLSDEQLEIDLATGEDTE